MAARPAWDLPPDPLRPRQRLLLLKPATFLLLSALAAGASGPARRARSRRRPAGLAYRRRRPQRPRALAFAAFLQPPPALRRRRPLLRPDAPHQPWSTPRPPWARITLLLWLEWWPSARSSPGRRLRGQAHRQLEAPAPVAIAAALVGAVCMRVASTTWGSRSSCSTSASPDSACGGAADQASPSAGARGRGATPAGARVGGLPCAHDPPRPSKSAVRHPHTPLQTANRSPGGPGFRLFRLGGGA